jgi:quinol monooxygenase YgiN
MYIVHVSIKVKEAAIHAFREATKQNAENSVLEEGVVRFDVLQQKDDATKFMLVEIYRSTDDQAKHRLTDHFKKWREDVAELIAEPYTIITYENVYPEDYGWK